jgi:hypothetical protein
MSKKTSLSQNEFMDYEQLKQMLDYSPTNGMYDELMNKESSVLETVNRVVNHSNQKQLESQEFLNLSISMHIGKFYRTMYAMFDDAFRVKSKEDMLLLFWNEDRIIYSGILIVLIVLFVFFISISISTSCPSCCASSSCRSSC